MKDLSFYEQAGIVLPGAVLLFGALLLLPGIQPLFLKDGISVGGLGLFLLVAYPLGHFIAALGNMLEKIVWAFAGGMPSTWIRNPSPRLLSASQIASVQEKLKKRLSVDVTISGMDNAVWQRCFSQLYSDVLNSGTPGRIETFNGNYGLNRGLAVSALVLIAVCSTRRPGHWEWWTGALTVFFVVHTYRMTRFGVYFAREVYYRFLLLPDNRT